MIKKYIVLVMLFILQVYAMDVEVAQKQPTIDDDTIFTIYGAEDETHIIEAPLQVLLLSSTLKGMVEDLDYSNASPIPIANASYKTLFRLVKMLEIYTRSADPLRRMHTIASAYSLPELVEIINCANYLGINDTILKVFGDICIQLIHKNHRFQLTDYEALKQCNHDFIKQFISAEIVPQIINHIKIRNLKKGDEDRKWSIENVPTGVTTSGYSGIFLNEDRWIAIGSMNTAMRRGQVNIYDTVSRQIVHTLDCDIRPNKLTAYKNKYVAVCQDLDAQFGLRIYNIADLNNVKVYDYHHPQGSSVQTMAFSPDGSRLVMVCNGDNDNIVFLDMNTIDWNAQQPTLDINTVVFFTARVGHKEDKICFIPNTSIFLVATSPQGNMRLARVNYETKVISSTFVPAKNNTFKRWFNFSKDAKYIVSLNNTLPRNDLEIELFDRITMQRIKEFDGPSPMHKTIVSVMFSPDNKWVVCANEGGKLYIYDSAQGLLTDTVNGLRTQNSLCFSADGNTILLAGSDPGMPYGYSGLLWTILTDQESTLLQGLYNCSIDQIIVVYQLCVQLAQKGFAIIDTDAPEMQIFKSLDQDLQYFLVNMGVSTGDTWGDWFINTIPDYMQIKQ